MTIYEYCFIINIITFIYCNLSEFIKYLLYKKYFIIIIFDIYI